ncbi:hypothetical protein Q629_02916 [Mycobacterium tuberculosis OFXR-19]|nr:hypothetical protein Q629_02916 [Mycobacterium tuberculosis OFXR-19]
MQAPHALTMREAPATLRAHFYEPPRHVRRLQFLERMGSCQVVHRMKLVEWNR